MGRSVKVNWSAFYDWVISWALFIFYLCLQVEFRPKILFDVKWVMQCFEVNSFFPLFLSFALNFQDIFSLRFEEMLFTVDSSVVDYERKGMSMDSIMLSQKGPFSISPRHTLIMPRFCPIYAPNDWE